MIAVEPSMKRKALWYLVLFAGCLIIIGVAIGTLGRSEDPSFNGRRLSASVYDLLEPDSPTYPASSNVVAQLGARAIPYLKETVARGESRLERMAMKFNLPLPAHRTSFGRQLAVCPAAQILGTNAAPLNGELIPLAQSPIGSIRLASLEALALTTPPRDLLPLVTNAIATDPFLDCRMTATRIALASMDAAEVVNLAIGNIGNGTKCTGEAARKFARELRVLAPAEILESALGRFSRSDNPEVRRFVATSAPVCLQTNMIAVEMLNRLSADTNAAVARAATNSLGELRRLN